MAKNRLEGLFPSRRKAKIFELRSEDSLNVLRLRCIKDFFAQKELAESVHASIDLGISPLGRQPEAPLLGEFDIFLEQVEAEDRILVRKLGVRFTPILLDDLGVALVREETIDEVEENVSDAECQNN